MWTFHTLSRAMQPLCKLTAELVLVTAVLLRLRLLMMMMMM